MSQRVLAACVVALLLVCMPMGVAAQEKDARAAEQASVLDWFAGIWGGLAAWLTGAGVAAPPTSSSGAHGDTGCLIDPDGCPHGG